MQSAPTDKTKKEEKQPTRAERLEANGGNPLFPDVGEAWYVVRHWQDAGAVSAGGMSIAPLSAVELQAWQQGAQLALAAWEFQTVLDMSRAYVVQSRESEKPECAPPYGDPAKEFDRDIVGKKVTNAFKSLIAAKRKT